jgi:formate dehydrogenase subunit gamma
MKGGKLGMTTKIKDALPESIERFNKNQRLQHLILFISIAFLVLTGFPIKYGQSQGAKFVVSLFGGFDNMLIVHLTAAVVMLLCGFYHILWLIKLFKTSGPHWSMLPSFKDVRDAYHHALYLLGARKEPPKYGRYTYLEKFEYLAVIYGILLMGISGFFLWFPNIAASMMPRWVMHMFRIAHSNEAVVCLLAIIIGHFYWVHFNPDVFPSSPVWYNGKISKHHLKHEHPLEYDQLTEGIQEQESHEHPAKFANSTPLMIFELCIYISVFVFLLSVFVPKLFS